MRFKRTPNQRLMEFSAFDQWMVSKKLGGEEKTILNYNKRIIDETDPGHFKRLDDPKSLQTLSNFSLNLSCGLNAPDPFCNIAN